MCVCVCVYDVAHEDMVFTTTTTKTTGCVPAGQRRGGGGGHGVRRACHHVRGRFTRRHRPRDARVCALAYGRYSQALSVIHLSVLLQPTIPYSSTPFTFFLYGCYPSRLYATRTRAHNVVVRQTLCGKTQERYLRESRSVFVSH